MKTNEGTKYIFAEAMQSLMKSNEIENITIKEIYAVSNLSRQTFYRHFYDKYDLINWYFDKLLNASFQEMGHGKTVYQALILKFNFLKAESLFFIAAFRNDSQNNLRDHDFEMIFNFYLNFIQREQHFSLNKSLYSLLEMYCQASIFMTVKWLLSGMQLSCEELANLMIDAMPAKLYQVFENLHLLQ